MQTKILPPTEQNLKNCALFLKNGGLVAFPTETVYGLGANAFDENAVKNIFVAKGRPQDNPLIVHVGSVDDIGLVAAEISDVAKKLICAFMPGALTVVLKKQPAVPFVVTGGLDTVAVRVPKNEIAQKLIRLSGVAVCAPSANTSTRPSPTTAEHILFDLNGKIPFIIDGGGCQLGIESTVCDATGEVVRVLRLGAVGVEDIERVCGAVEVCSTKEIRSPGVKYAHYAPKCELRCFEYSEDGRNQLCAVYDECTKKNLKPLIICLNESIEFYKNRRAISAGENDSEYAKNLYALLRDYENDFDILLLEGVLRCGIGSAVMNRLEKAQSKK